VILRSRKLIAELKELIRIVKVPSGFDLKTKSSCGPTIPEVTANAMTVIARQTKRI
jgi:hypothetical protein